MSIKVHYGGLVFVADTPEEAIRLAELLERDLSGKASDGDAVGDISAAAESWTPELFLAFLRRLGDSQKAALAVLVERHHVSDEYLRNELGVAGNQALAGILSGLSKQAIALGLSARSVFRFQNIRKTGKRQSIYSVAKELEQIAGEMCWPGEKAILNNA